MIVIYAKKYEKATKHIKIIWSKKWYKIKSAIAVTMQKHLSDTYSYPN